MDLVPVAAHKHRSPPREQEPLSAANPAFNAKDDTVRAPRAVLRDYHSLPIDGQMTVAMREEARRSLETERLLEKEKRAMTTSSIDILNTVDSNHDGELSRNEVEMVLSRQDEDMKVLRGLVTELRHKLSEKMLEDMAQHASKILEQAERASRRGYVEQSRVTVSDGVLEHTLKTQQGVRSLLRDSHSKYEDLKDAQLVSAYQEQLNQANQTIQDLRGHLSKAQSDLDDKVVVEERRQAKRHDDMQNAQQKIVDLDLELDTVKSQLKEANEKNKELAQRVASNRGDQLSLTQVRESNDKGCAIYHGGSTSSWAAAENIIKELCQGYNKLEAKLHAVEEEAKAKCAEYEASIEKLEASIEDKNDAIEECEDEIEALKGKHAADIEALEEEHSAALEEQTSEATAMQESFDEQINELQARIAAVEAQNQQLTVELSKTQEQLKVAEKKNEAIEAQKQQETKADVELAEATTDPKPTGKEREATEPPTSAEALDTGKEEVEQKESEAIETQKQQETKADVELAEATTDPKPTGKEREATEPPTSAEALDTGKEEVEQKESEAIETQKQQETKADVELAEATTDPKPTGKEREATEPPTSAEALDTGKEEVEQKESEAIETQKQQETEAVRMRRQWRDSAKRGAGR